MRGLKDDSPETLRGYMQDLARLLESVLPPGPGIAGRALFVLLLVDNEDEARQAHYISNANRQDCIKFLREAADRLERREDRKGGDAYYEDGRIIVPHTKVVPGEG